MNITMAEAIETVEKHIGGVVHSTGDRIFIEKALTEGEEAALRNRLSPDLIDVSKADEQSMVKLPMVQPEGIEDLDTVERVEGVVDNKADCVAILNEATNREIHTFYLRELFEEWEMVDYHLSKRHDTGWMQFKRRRN